jgi:hypothetical protein
LDSSANQVSPVLIALLAILNGLLFSPLPNKTPLIVLAFFSYGLLGLLESRRGATQHDEPASQETPAVDGLCWTSSPAHVSVS